MALSKAPSTETPPGRRVFAARRAGRRAAGLLLGAGLVAGIGLAADPELRHAALRRLLFGGPLIELRSPLAGSRLAPGGIYVAAGFPLPDRSLAETLRVELNGRPVTAELSRGRSGVLGSVRGGVEGENRLEVSIFGRVWWGTVHFEDRVEVVFSVGPSFWLDRARRLDRPRPAPSLRAVAAHP